MSQSQMEASSPGRRALGLVIAVIGGIMALGVVIKMAIGFYIHDLPILGALTASGLVLVWVGEKLTD